MSKGRILFCNVFPQIPAAASAYFCICIRCMVLISVNGSFRTASVCDKDKVIFCQENIVLFSVHFAFNRCCDLFAFFKGKYNVCHFGVELEIYACFFQIFLHRQDQGFILIVFSKFQSTEIRQSGDVMNKSLEVELHFQCTVPVFKCKHRSPVQPEGGIKHFVIKYIFDCFIIKIFVFCHEQFHDLHAAFLA